METRPDVLGYPSPTTSRYLILAAALVASGLFVGNWVHSQVRGHQWLASVRTCAGQRTGGTTLGDRLRSQDAFESCAAHAERTRTAFAVGGTVVVVVLAAAVLFLAPAVVRRRRHLRTPGPALSGAVARFDELAHEAGVSHRVRPLLGTSRQRDAFSFGAPGRYAVALPPAVAVRWRDARLFDPLVRHELAHAKQRDIALAWLTRSVAYALVPILAFPVVTALVGGDTSLVGDYLWRAALLGGVVVLLSAALLRSREYAADLRAAQWQGDPGALEAVVSAARPRPTGGLRRPLARHPTPDQRIAVLRAPGLLVRSGFVDGLTGAFLGGLTVPLVVGSLSPLFAGSGDATRGYLFASLLLGPVLGASVGLAVWRDALFGRVSGAVHAAGPVAAGVGIGLVAGQAVSLGQTASGLTVGLTHPAWLLVSAAAGAGITVMSAGLAQLWADAAPRLPGLRTCWIVALVVNAVLFSALLWSTSMFQLAVDSGGWASGRTELSFGLTGWWMFWIVVGLGVAAALPVVLRRTDATPSWLVEGNGGSPWPTDGIRDLHLPIVTGLVSGLVATAVLVGYRAAAGLAPSDSATVERFLAYQWVVALAAAIAATVLVVGDPVRGPGLAAVAVLVAAAVGSAGWFVLNVSLGAAVNVSFAMRIVRPVTVMGWYAMLVLLPVAYLLGRLPRLESVRTPVAATAAAVLTVTAGAAALDQREHLVAPADLDSSVLAQPLVPGAGGDATAYLVEVVPLLTREYGAVDQAARALLADPTLTPAEKADALEQQVEPAVSELVAEWELFTPQPGDVARAHAVALSALRTADLEYRILIPALRAADPAGVARAQQLRDSETQLWRDWFEWQATLTGE